MIKDPLLVGVHSHVLTDVHDWLQNASGNPMTSLEQLTFRTTDLAPGKTTRVAQNAAGDEVTLSVSHSQTNENAPYKTNRVLVRFDISRFDAQGKEVVLSVYQVIALPLGSLFTVHDAVSLAASLNIFSLVGEWNGPGTLGASECFLPRLLAGEP